MIKLFFILFTSLLFSQNLLTNIESLDVIANNDIDVTDKFDKAIEYVCKNGGTLYIPKGIYNLDYKNRHRSGIYNNNYIFLVSKSFNIIMDGEAVLVFKNGFKGFRFRTTQDPTDRTINRFDVKIKGGIIEGSNNDFGKIKGNPEIWSFVGETLNKFTVENLKVHNFKGSSGVASYSNNYFEIKKSTFTNVTGNPNDLIDNHGDAIYIANTKNYHIDSNNINNTISLNNRIGRVGICIEYEKSGDGTISNNLISGYDRGVHIELINGNTLVKDNRIIGNSSGVVLWNNQGYKHSIISNHISNWGLSKENISILYTSSPILMLGYNTNNGTVIQNNDIKISRQYFLPKNMLQITSSNILVSNNIFNDETKTLTLSIAQGKGNKEKVENIIFSNNQVYCKSIDVYDATNLNITQNNFQIIDGALSLDYKKNILKNNIFSNEIKIYGNYSK